MATFLYSVSITGRSVHSANDAILENQHSVANLVRPPGFRSAGAKGHADHKRLDARIDD